MPIRTTPKEIALLAKLDRLPVSTRRTFKLRQFDLSHSRMLCLYRSMMRGSRRYMMQCDVREGVLDVSFSAWKADGKAFRMPKARRFPGQLGW